MSKRKTRQQKIIANLHRKLHSEAIGTPSSTYTYTNTSQPVAALQQPISNTTNIASIRSDLSKTAIVTIAIITMQLFLFYLLKNHLISIPMLGY